MRELKPAPSRAGGETGASAPALRPGGAGGDGGAADAFGELRALAEGLIRAAAPSHAHRRQAPPAAAGPAAPAAPATPVSPVIAGVAARGGEQVLLDLEVEGVRCVLMRRPDAAPPEIALSPREREIARMVAKGYPNKTIAGVLEISSWTVSTHLRRIFAKLSVSSRAAMVARLAQLGLIG